MKDSVGMIGLIFCHGVLTSLSFLSFYHIKAGMPSNSPDDQRIDLRILMWTYSEKTDMIENVTKEYKNIFLKMKIPLAICLIL